MSKATRQSLTMLSVCAACFWQMHKLRHFARVDIHEMCMEGYKTVEGIFIEWPAPQDEFNRSIPSIQAWAKAMEEDTNKLSAKVLLYMIGRITDDLLMKIRNKDKRELVQRIVKMEKKLSGFIDQEGAHFADYEHADYLLDKLYKLIDWQW